jgi:sulfite exporter TauE/SafE
LLAGLLVILLRVAIPEQIATSVGLGVAVIIVALGGRVVYSAWRAEPTCHCHTRTAQPSQFRTGWKPLLIGMMHGLAGSAGLTLLILTDVMRGGSAARGVAYLLIFGVGSIGGMMMMSAVVSLPFVFSTGRFERFAQPIKFIAGFSSVLFGLYYAWQVLSGQAHE